MQRIHPDSMGSIPCLPLPPSAKRQAVVSRLIFPIRSFLLATLVAAILPHIAAASSPVAGVDETEADKTADADSIVELVRNRCAGCHTGDDPAGGLELDRFHGAASVTKDRRQWMRILGRVAAGEMPPADDEALSPDLKDRLVKWVEPALQMSTESDAHWPNPLRRLNRYQYSATIRDLFDIHIDAGQALPVEGAGGEGFDNAAETLFTSAVHIEKYMEAAKLVTEYVARDTAARAKLFFVEPNDEVTEEQAASHILERFLSRAFGRPCSPELLADYLRAWQKVHEQTGLFERSILRVVEQALLSPEFLFRSESANADQAPELADHFEIASRLSYFLWSSIPDEELWDSARAGKLHDAAELKSQTLRMLTATHGSNRSDVPKARSLAENFMGQWLGTRDLGPRFKPDPNVYPNYDYEVEFGLRYEPIYYLEHMLVENRSLLELIDSDYTFMNNDTARVYEYEGKIRGYGQMRLVELPEDSPRGGVLTMGAVLAVSSYPHRSSPVLRGKWILDTLLDVNLPPPPADVPALDESTETQSQRPSQQSLRQRLARHREDAACASCHNRIDPLGFPLENFDVIGRWRDEDAGAPVDAVAKLGDGRTLTGVEDLKAILLERKDEFLRGLIAKMLSYALGRGLVNQDFLAVEKILIRLRENDYLSQELILGIVESEPFRYKSGAARANVSIR